MGINHKVKVKWDGIAKALIKSGATVLTFKFSNNPELASSVGTYVENVLDVVEIDKKEKTPAEKFGAAFEKIIRDKINDKNSRFVIKNGVTEDEIINEIAMLELKDSVVSEGNITEVNKAICEVLSKNGVFVENIKDDVIDEFIGSITEELKTVVLSDESYLLLYTYKTVDRMEYKTGIMYEMLKAIHEYILSTQSPFSKYKLVSKLPHAIAQKKFVGRNDKLDELAKRFTENSMVFISGVGGIGKSELAAQYYERNKKYTVIHMNYIAGSKDGDYVDRSGLRKLIMEMYIEDYPQFSQNSSTDEKSQSEDNTKSNISDEKEAYYKAKLNTLRSICDENVLLIIDNFNVSDDEGLRDIESINCKKIFTTKFDYHKMYAQVDVDYLNKEDVFELFCNHLKKSEEDEPKKHLSEQDKTDIENIINRLGGHTTAIILIASQIAHSRRISINEMLIRIKNAGINNVGDKKITYNKDGQNLKDKNAFEHLCKIFDIAELDEISKYILANLSMLPVEGIDLNLFFEWCKLKDEDEEYLDNLISMRWISETDDGRIYLIPVISDVVFETAKPDFIKCEDLLLGLKNEYKSLSIEKKLERQSYLEYITEKVSRLDINSNDSEEALKIANNIVFAYAKMLADNKSYTNAINLYKKSCDVGRVLCDRKLDIYGNDLARSLNNHAILLKATGRIDEAEMEYDEAIKIRRFLYTKLPRKHDDALARLLNNHAILLKAKGQVKEAEKEYDEAIRLRRILYKKSSSKYGKFLAGTLNNHANLLKSVGQVKEAEKEYDEAIKIREQLYKKFPESYGNDYATSLNNYALLLNGMGKVKEAEKEYKKAIKIRHPLYKKTPKVYGNDYASLLTNYADLLKATARVKEAEKEYKKAIKIRKLLYEKNSEIYGNDYANSITNYADLLKVTGRVEEAEKKYDEAIKIRKLVYEKSPEVYGNDYANSITNYADLLKVIGRVEEAEKKYDEAIKIRKLLYEKSPEVYGNDYANSITNYADLLKVTGRVEEAEKKYDEAIKIRKLLYEKSPEVYGSYFAISLCNYGLLPKDIDDAEETEKNLQEAAIIYIGLYKKAPEMYEKNATTVFKGYYSFMKSKDKLKEAEKYFADNDMVEEFLMFIEKIESQA